MRKSKIHSGQKIPATNKGAAPAKAPASAAGICRPATNFPPKSGTTRPAGG
jgi:hypothetical protein